MFHPRPFSERRDAPARCAAGLLTACILMTGGAAAPLYISTVAQSGESKMKAQAEGEGNRVTVKTEGDAVVVDVSSRSGIGRAIIELASGAAPQPIVLRLHLKGLEEFRFLRDLPRDGAEVIARVSSGDGSITQSLRSPGGGEKDITSTNPLWLGVKLVSDQTAPRIPLSQGHFEITLPKDFLRAGDRSFSIRWIDFYR